MKPQYAIAFERSREQLGMSKKDYAAQVLGINQYSYRDLLNGKSKPSWNTMQLAVLYGGCDPFEMLGLTPPQDGKPVRFTIHAPDHVPTRPDTCAIARTNIGPWEVRAELTPQRARQLAQELLKLADENEMRQQVK